MFGVYPNLIRPTTFNEKVLHRRVFDRRPILTTLQDKYAVREYVRARIGDHVLPNLYWVTKNPADIPFDELPDKFVVKATHGCGWNYLVPDKARVDREDVMAKCASWLNWNYYEGGREWAYKNIEPRIIVEEFISDDTGLSPRGYKAFVFNGQVHMIWVITKKFVSGPTKLPALDVRDNYYAPSWDLLDIRAHVRPIGRLIPRPPHLAEMIRCAEVLGDGLDFVRIDFYEGWKLYFGEITIYPNGGFVFHDLKSNHHFGGLWDLSVGRTGTLSQKGPATTGTVLRR
jgi:hypothetical protein